MLAWLFGVIRILYWVSVVVALIGVVSVIAGASLPGFATEPYTVDPALSVISTRLNPPEVPAASATVIAVTDSAPESVMKVKESLMVADPPGARLELPGSVPLPRVFVFDSPIW